jgi:hypothetical protein
MRRIHPEVLWRDEGWGRVLPHFRFIGEFSPHFGLFEGCGAVLRIPRGSLPPDTAELALRRLLQRYRKQREARLLVEGASKRQLTTDRRMITNLQKRSPSSVEAFARTLAVHQRSRAAKRHSERQSPVEGA